MFHVLCDSPYMTSYNAPLCFHMAESMQFGALFSISPPADTKLTSGLMANFRL